MAGTPPIIPPGGPAGKKPAAATKPKVKNPVVVKTKATASSSPVVKREWLTCLLAGIFLLLFIVACVAGVYLSGGLLSRFGRIETRVQGSFYNHCTMVPYVDKQIATSQPAMATLCTSDFDGAVVRKSGPVKGEHKLTLLDGKEAIACDGGVIEVLDVDEADARYFARCVSNCHRPDALKPEQRFWLSFKEYVEIVPESKPPCNN